MKWLATELPWDSPTVGLIPLPPFSNAASHARYVQLLQLHLALVDPAGPTLSTIALSATLEQRAGWGAPPDPWLSPLELTTSLTSWFPAPWTPEALALTLQHAAGDPSLRSGYPRQGPNGWEWMGDPDFAAEPANGGWRITRHERGNVEVGWLPDDRALVVLWMSHFRHRFALPLGRSFDPALLPLLAPASRAVAAADEVDAAYPYRVIWREQRDTALGIRPEA